MDLVHAIDAHMLWRVRFRSALARGQTLDVSTISADDQCEVGRWLKGQGKIECGTNAAYAKLVEQHRDFHRCAGAVAAAITHGSKPEAERLLAVDFKAVSMLTVAAIAALKKTMG